MIVSLPPDAAVAVPAFARIQAPSPMLVDWAEKLPEQLTRGIDALPNAGTGRVPDFRMVGMLLHRYILLESEDGLVMLDPKAAWERIYFEKLVKPGGGILETQGLLVPVLLELDPRDLDLVLRERLALQEAGIEVEAFGGNTLQIRSLPACLSVPDPRPFLGALMDELLHDHSPGAKFAFDRLAKVLAKRAAADKFPKLSEVRQLLEDLFACELPYCAADGRPTLTEFGIRELDRRFGITRT